MVVIQFPVVDVKHNCPVRHGHEGLRSDNPMGRIAFDHVVKKYGDVVAVNDISFEVADGEFLVLVGPSGCGKTSALRCLAGLEEVTEGSSISATAK